MSEPDSNDKPSRIDSSQDKREDPRLPRQERAFIRVLLSDGAALMTQTEDISRGGFRATLSEPIAIGSIFHVVIELQASQLRFLLAAEARWCQPVTANEHRTGFALLDARGTDYEAWRQFVEARDEN